MSALSFIKMHGAGNDFVIVDARAHPFDVGSARARAIADRRTGVGCDQLLVVEAPRTEPADVFMRIINADGGEVEACGNGARCVAALIMEEKGSDEAVIETAAGMLPARAAGKGVVAIDMGRAGLDWRDIPLAEPADTLRLDIEAPPLADPVAVNMGNPHMVFFVDDAEAVPLEALGRELEHHPMFPHAANVGVAQVLSADRLRLRVWERGTGITRACGTGACAALVAASRRGLTGRAGEVRLDGGVLDIEWLPDDHVLLSGPVARSFSGTLHETLSP